MSEWWSYSPADFLMFSPATYYRLFEIYNRAVWPAQMAAVLAGLAIAALAWRRRGHAAAAVLGMCWLWVAWGFLYSRLATIHLAAPYFATAFAVQGLLLILLPPALDAPPGRRTVGLALLLAAVLVQPLFGPLVAGRSWWQAELFGLAPDPTALATLGLLLQSAQRRRGPLLVVPLAWCGVSGATLWSLAAPESTILLSAAAVTLAALLPWPARR